MKQWLMDFLRALSGRDEYHYHSDLAPTDHPDLAADDLKEYLWKRGWLIEIFDRLDSPGHGARVVIVLRISRPPA